MNNSSTFRWLVTLLTAVCVPLCCCRLDSLFKTCEACGGERPTCHRSHHDDDADVLQTPTGDHRDHDHSAPKQSKPGHHQKGDGCRCGGDKKISTVEGKPQFTFQPLVLTYLSPYPVDLEPPSGLLAGIRPDSRAPFRPAQTLLRQHCALIV